MNVRLWLLACAYVAGCTIGVDDPQGFGEGDAASNGADAGDETGTGGTGEGGSDTDPATDEGGSTGGEAEDSGGSTGGSDDGVPACDADLDNDPDHCGECDHACLGGLCEEGACQPILLAAGLNWPNAAVVEGDRVLVGADDGLYSVPKTGGGGQLLHAGTVRNVVVDEERIYWVDSVALEISSLEIGGARATVHVSDLAQAHGLVADEGNLYWIDGGVNRIAKTGGNPHGVIAESGDPFEPAQLALGEGRIFYRTEGGDLRSVLSTGGEDMLLDNSPTGYHGTGYHDGFVYAFRGDDGADTTTLVRMSPAGGGVPEELVGGQSSPESMAFDETHVYWRTFAAATSQILRVPHEGGAAELLATSPGYSLGLAVDDEAVYWCETDGGNVVKLAK